MGAVLSSPAYDFKPATMKLNTLVSGIMADSDPLASQERCMSDYNIVLGKELGKMKKLPLKALNDTVYFIPDMQAMHTRSEIITKRDLCVKISSHYGRALAAISLIKTTYDTENFGTSSFWSKTRDERLVLDKTLKKVVEVRYCDQKSPREIKLQSQVRGIEEFVAFLSQTEKNTVLRHLHSLSSGSLHDDIEMLTCGDELFSPSEYRSMYSHEKFKSPWASESSAPQCRRNKELVHLVNMDTTFTTTQQDPKTTSSKPFATKEAKCEKIRNVNVSNLPSKQQAAIQKAYKTTYEHAAKNLQGVYAILSDLVRGSPSMGYEMRHLTASQLDAVILRLKRSVAGYFLATLYDFNYVANVAVEHAKIK